MNLDKLKKIFSDDPEVLKAIEKKELDLNLKTLDEKIGKDKFVEVRVNGELLPVLKGDRGEKGDKGDSVQGPKGDKGNDGKDADEEKIIKKISKFIPTKEEILSQIKIPIPASPDVNKIVEEVLSKVPKTEIDHKEILDSVVKELKEKKLLELRDIKGARLDRASGGFDMNDQRWHGAGLLDINGLIRAGINIYITGTGVPGDPYIINIDITPITYSDLNDLINASNLRPHAWYLIEDFQTVELVPVSGTVHFGQSEPLVVQAISTLSLAKEAFSPSFPGDILEYDFIDSTLANPSVVLPNGNYGRISYRRRTDTNQSTYYDFRNIVFYHPDSTYTIPIADYPITPVDVMIGGTPIGLPGTVINDDTELAAFFEDPANALENLAGFNGSDVVVFSLNGLDWGDFNYLDNALNPQVSTPTFKAAEYYTFDNGINPSTGMFAPAPDGNGINPDCHIGICSDTTVGTVLNNVLLSGKSSNIEIDSETINGVICGFCRVIRVGQHNLGFIIKGTCTDIILGDQCTSSIYQTTVGEKCNTIRIGDVNTSGVVIPKGATNWRIGSGLTNTFSMLIDFRTCVTLQNRVCEVGFSNVDEIVSCTNNLKLSPWTGIGNVVGNPVNIDIVGSLGVLIFPITIKPKLTEIITTAPAYPAGTNITGVLTGATGQIVNTITDASFNTIYQIITYSVVTFAGETDITDGSTPEVVSSVTVGQLNVFNPLTCQPSVGGNVIVDRGSGPIKLDGNYGDYIVFDNDSYDQVNVYQKSVHNFRP